MGDRSFRRWVSEELMGLSLPRIQEWVLQGTEMKVGPMVSSLAACQTMQVFSTHGCCNKNHLIMFRTL